MEANSLADTEGEVSDILTDEQLGWIREGAEDPRSTQNLRALLAHYDATVAKHADIIGNCRSALAGFTGPEENIPDEIVARNAHANSNADNLRVQVADLELIVATLKNVLLCDEGQLKLEQKRTQSERDQVIAAALDAAQYLTRAETAERNLVQAQAQLSDARADRDLAQAATKAETICRRGAEHALFLHRKALAQLRLDLTAILESMA
jgi:hypothetical protein